MPSKSILIATAAVLLASCGERPTDMAKMSETITATLSETGTPAAAGKRVAVNVSAGFGPAVRAAVEGNEGYRAAVALETEAMGRVGVAESARRPQLRANTTVGGIRETGGGTKDQTTTGLAGGMNVAQLIYDGGESAAAVNQATAEALAAQAAREARANELALDVASAWIDVWQFQERLSLLRTSLSEMNELVAQIERMATNGMLDRAALDGALAQIVDIRLEEKSLQADLQEAQLRFERYFNRGATGIGRPGELVSIAEARAAAQAWTQAPVLRRSAAELLIARSAVSGAEAAFRPRARLQAGVTSPMQEGESTDTSVGVMVEYTFGDGGQRRSQLAAANARAEAADAQLSDAQRSLQAELDAALARLTAIDRSMPLLEEKMRLSEAEAETARSQIATGQSNLRQLGEAAIESYRACDRHIMMEAEKMTIQVTIASLTGALGRKLGLGAVASQ